MGYHVIEPTDLNPLPDRSATARLVSEAVGLNTLGVRTYEAAPGEQVPLAYHYHERQEEVFYVIEGELHVETPDREYVVGAGKLFVVEPGNPHRAYNPSTGDGVVRVLAVGAPTSDPGLPYE